MSISTALRRGKGRIVLICIAIAIPAGIATAYQLAPPPTSPATGHAQVVTQGIAGFSDQQMVWRVVQRTAQPRWEAKATRSVLGFVLASEEPVLLTNVTDNNQKQDVARLGVGESFWVKGGVKQIRASMGDHPVTYLSLEVVREADANEVGRDTLLLKSDPFTPPDGERDVDLVRNVLRLNENATLPDTGSSVFILATDGAIDILPGSGGQPTTLQAGESGIFSGPLQIKAVQPSGEGVGQIAAVGLTSTLLQEASNSAGYIVAAIGTDIPPVPTRTPESTASPTASTTTTSTGVPTIEPATESPTEFSTDIPTVETTLPPTETPTETPTEEPTLEPSPTKGRVPTNEPTPTETVIVIP
jgi:hypothetical protein